MGIQDKALSEAKGPVGHAEAIGESPVSSPVRVTGFALMSVVKGAGTADVSRLRASMLLGLACAGLALTGCAQQPTHVSAGHGHEYFSTSKYGPASARVVEDGQPVPRGGGQYLVGHPYTIAGRTYYPRENEDYSAVGMASWYGSAFHGRRTANGEVYDMRALTAAHPTMPLPSYARVTNLTNGYSVVVRVNDRGPYHGGRVMDVSSRVADVLDFKGAGTAKIKVEYVGRAPLDGSDDDRLLASLRTDGAPARLDGSAGVMVAEQEQSVTPISPLLRLISPSAPKATPVPAHAPALATVEQADEAPSAPRVPLANPPIPPARPFDLGSISKTLAPPMPPMRISSNDNRALNFTTPQHRPDPLAKLIHAKVAKASTDEED